MDARTWILLFLVPLVVCEWKQYEEDPRSVREARRDIHYHSKRHMLPREGERKRRTTTQRTKEVRKKPSGHLRPLKEDDIENDEVVSVAIGPPAMRPKYEKTWKPATVNNTKVGATSLVKDILTQLGREFLNRNVGEDFVFGQYVGNAMKNLTADLKVKMQHEVLELIVKYQRINLDESQKHPQAAHTEEKNLTPVIKDIKDKKFGSNDTEEGWPDFSNLAKIVG